MPVKMKRIISLKEPHLANSLSVAIQLLAPSDHRHIFDKLQELLSAPGCIWPFTLATDAKQKSALALSRFGKIILSKTG
jgi:hypothetical protein